MGLLGFLFGCKSGGTGVFKTDQFYSETRTKQMTGAPKVVEQLRKLGITDQSQLKLEYFFYTNTSGKAEALAKALSALGYKGGISASTRGPNEFAVTGWTGRMKMDDKTVLEWVGSMCDLGKQHDSEFDGWGTNPKQP
jgi:hypothetical protein